MTEKELFIGIWQVPPSTEENYKMLVDCGINAIFLNGEYSEDIEEQKKGGRLLGKVRYIRCA